MTSSATSAGRAAPRSDSIVQPDGTKETPHLRVDPREDRAQGAARQRQSHREPRRADGKELKIGIINLPAFYGDTVAMLRGDPDAVSATADCRQILEDFRANGVEAVVMDLRGNGGGLLEEAKTLSGLFIDTGPGRPGQGGLRRQAPR